MSHKNWDGVIMRFFVASHEIHALARTGKNPLSAWLFLMARQDQEKRAER
jgi:hypothetical protein